MSNSYVDFDGLVMAQTGAPTVWKNTTGAGQTLTGVAGANNQLSDQYGGAPTLIGGGGDDTFSIMDANTKIVESTHTGIDTVNAWCNYTMAANLKDLNLESANVSGVANNLGDLIIALGAHDTLTGGTGLDVLVDGGAGGDTFAFNTAGNHDVVSGFQASGANHDILQVSNFGYSTFAQVQSHLSQVGANTLLTLSSSDAVLIQNTTVASLVAADFSLAAPPATTAVVAAAPAVVAAPVVVAPTSGPPSVHLASAYTNYSGQVMYLSAAPTAWINTTAAGQTLTAGAAATQLSDQHGGAPTLNAGTGDDTFNILDANTKIVEAANGAVDTVNAWCNYTMAANLKDLNLESASVTGVANNLGDLMVALGAHDTLTGGTGLDVLVDGGAGGDTFAFNTAGNHDVVSGFQASGANHDILQVSNFGYSTFAQVQSHLSQVGSNTLLTLSSTDAVLIKNTTVASLVAADFALAAVTAPVTTTAPAPVATSIHPASAYTNYSGQVMYLSAAPTAWISTTAAGQTLTAGAAATQLSDQHGGAPTLNAGAGDDTFSIGDPNTKIVAAANGAVDTVNTWANYTMAANLKDMNLETTNISGVANNLGDLIVALGAHDTLTGGTGLDVLVDGGAGGDTFAFNTAGNHDVVSGFQASGTNHDILQVSNFGYSTFAQVQSHLSQVGANTLLTLSSTDAVLIQNTTVASLTAADFTLAAATVSTPTSVASVASVATPSAASTAPLSTYENYAGQAVHLSTAPTVWLSTTAAGQTLTAGAAPTQLSDQFGGAPTLIGGTGNDTFSIGDPNTQIIVASTTVVDTVNAWCNYTLPANVQNLTIETAHSTGVGNNMGDLLIAEGQNDTLIGGKGAVLVDGGAGSDVFSFRQGGGQEAISGFQASGVNHDFIQLTNYGFTSFAQVQSDLSQVGANTLLTLSGGDSVLIRNTTVASLNADDFLLQLDTSQMTMTFNGEFNSLSLYNAATGEGLYKTNYISGVQASSGAQSYSSRTLVGNAEQEIYVDPSYQGTGSTPLGLNPFSISNGVLTITGSAAPTSDVSALSGYKYTSGLLTTQASFSQLYGYFEIKAELPTGQGVWPAFWLLPANGNWPPEIDAMEAVGGNKIYQTTHTDTTGAPTATAFTTDLSNVSNTFNTYGVLWTPKDINYYVNGVEVASMATPSDMNTPMYMLVDLALGGTWPGDVSSNFSSTQMKIDYIHAYSLNSTQASTAAAAAGSSTVYVTQSATDTLPAAAEIVQSAYSFSLAGTKAQTLQLTGSANINATANNLGDNISGNAGANVLTGGTGNDTITAGTGNATMIGGGGTDTFVFNLGAGHDVINDFGGHDVINISSYLHAGYTPTLTDSGANVTISFSTGTTIELLGIHAASLISTAVGYTH